MRSLLDIAKLDNGLFVIGGEIPKYSKTPVFKFLVV